MGGLSFSGQGVGVVIVCKEKETIGHSLHSSGKAIPMGFAHSDTRY